MFIDNNNELCHCFQKLFRFRSCLRLTHQPPPTQWRIRPELYSGSLKNSLANNQDNSEPDNALPSPLHHSRPRAREILKSFSFFGGVSWGQQATGNRQRATGNRQQALKELAPWFVFSSSQPETQFFAASSLFQPASSHTKDCREPPSKDWS